MHRNVLGQEIAQLADWDEETITTVIAAVLGIGAGLGIPIFFVTQEARDKERIEEIRELNRATLKATGEQMSEEEIKEFFFFSVVVVPVVASGGWVVPKTAPAAAVLTTNALSLNFDKSLYDWTTFFIFIIIFIFIR